jgi:hypothetical protein
MSDRTLAGLGGLLMMAVLVAGWPVFAWPRGGFVGRSLSSSDSVPEDSAWLMTLAGPRGRAGPSIGEDLGRPTFSQGGFSAPPSVLRDMPTSRADRGVQLPMVARYSVSEGAVFVLDRSSGVALLKFDDSPEILVLQPSPAPRGDIIYKNDLGEPVLRATRLGGLTLFTDAAPAGAAAAFAGGADDLQLPAALSPSAVFQRMVQASARASRAAQHLITFDAADVTPDSAPVFADAATVAAEAVVALSRRDDGRMFLRRLDRMSFLVGSRPGAQLKPGAMLVFIDASQGLAGRPSSERLIHTALGK